MDPPFASHRAETIRQVDLCRAGAWQRHSAAVCDLGHAIPVRRVFVPANRRFFRSCKNGRIPHVDRLSGLDDLFLRLEGGGAHMRVGAGAIFEGPVPAYEDLVRTVGERLPLFRATASD